MAPRSIAYRQLFCALALANIAGCSSIQAMFEPARMDYRTSGQTAVRTLEVPPDLTQLQKDNRYSLPDPAKSAVTASGYNLQQGAASSAVAPAQVIAPITAQSMHIERAGGQRWLVVKQSPEVLWPEVKDFWQELGFIINIETPASGVMETDWAENRAKIPQDPIRNSIGKVLDSLYSTGERDKFRTRLERGSDGTTEVYISHRGAQEVVTGQQKDGTVWTPRPSDPELEAEFLARLMTRLASETTTAKAATVATASSVAATPQVLHAKMVKDTGGDYLEVDEGFDRAWRRVGLALDRVGFTVEDRDRVEGTYFVRYVDQSKEAKDKNGGGFLSRLFSGKDKSLYAQRYRVLVKGRAVDNSRISVLDNDGAPETSKTAEKILSLLNEQLK